MIRQKLLHGEHRERLGACVIKEINAKIRNISERYDVSRSYVIAVALAEVFGIKKQETYYDQISKPTKIRKIS